MKKPLVLVFLAQFIALIFVSAALAGPELKELSPGVFAMVGGDGSTNSGFVVTGEGVVVIDTQGPPELAKLLKKKIRKTTNKKIVFVINTHYHGDHAFGNQYFREGVILAHENTRTALIERDEKHKSMFRKFFGEESLREFFLTLPDVTFVDRMTLWVGTRKIELVYAGPRAHTGGDIFVWLPEEKVLFAGDLLYKGRLPLLNDGETLGALNALDKIAATKAVTLVPGHGPVSTMEDAAIYRGYIEALRAEVQKMMDSGMNREDVSAQISLPAYSSWIMYKEWLPVNAGRVFDELMAEREKKN